jgi:predicted amidophosphoribosyltransferase
MQLRKRKYWSLLLSGDVYGLLPYESLWRKQAMDRELSDARNFIYRFKTRGINRGLIMELVRKSADTLGCKQIIAIPSSEPKENQLQRIFGTHIATTGRTDKAKYLEGRKDYEGWPLRFSDGIEGTKTLLVDDVVASGKTMDFFARRLMRIEGMEIVKFALAISTRRKYGRSEINVSIRDTGDKIGDIINMQLDDIDFSAIL